MTTYALGITATNLFVALLLGACIGFERQWRQRLAGLRTNTLVALGAATFVVFESTVGDPASRTRVAAQVVSGIGFLGAGIIFREGLNVRGLNTALILQRRSGVPPRSQCWSAPEPGGRPRWPQRWSFLSRPSVPSSMRRSDLGTVGLASVSQR